MSLRKGHFIKYPQMSTLPEVEWGRAGKDTPVAMSTLISAEGLALALKSLAS